MWALVSAKGSPGVTTLGLAMAAASPAGEGLFAELDPAGGDVAVWARSAYEPPGLMALAAAGRRGISPELLAEHVRSGGAGLAVLLGPTDGAQAAAALGSTGPILAAALAAWPGPAFADCGRFSLNSPVGPVLSAAQATVLVLRPEPAELEHARCLLPTIRSLSKDVVAVVTARRPSKPREVGEVLGVEVVGVVDRDPRAAEAIARAASVKGLRRTALVRSAATILDRLGERSSRPELRAAG